ncbi:hypothetical protein [Caballeronia sp. GAFFF1]|uniref:hypothetical protein n=1 Tax=Caballeronia sp. GAFFF1 TaxID=2921779 RepID=UPI002028A494|nr:hypothetical protein [Caballeronia sp. GAFFF1]
MTSVTRIADGDLFCIDNTPPAAPTRNAPSLAAAMRWPLPSTKSATKASGFARWLSTISETAALGVLFGKASNATVAVRPCCLSVVDAPACMADAADIANGGDTSAPRNVIVPPGMVYAFADNAKQPATPAIAIRQLPAPRTVMLFIVFPLLVVLSRFDAARIGGYGLTRSFNASDDNKRTPIDSTMTFRLRR